MCDEEKEKNEEEEEAEYLGGEVIFVN